MLKGWLIHRTLFGFLLVLSLGMIEIGCGGGGATDPPTDPPCSTCPVVGSGTIPVVAHVFVLVEENHSYSQVIGNAAMPYTNMLAQKYSLATQYYANRFNSLPNYFMLTVGNLITTNDLYTGTVTADNVARAVTKAGKTWKIYAESLPNIGYLGQALGIDFPGLTSLGDGPSNIVCGHGSCVQVVSCDQISNREHEIIGQGIEPVRIILSCQRILLRQHVGVGHGGIANHLTVGVVLLDQDKDVGHHGNRSRAGRAGRVSWWIGRASPAAGFDRSQTK